MGNDIQKKRITELPESNETEGLYTLGVNKMNESVKVPLGKMLASVTPVLISEDAFDSLSEKDENTTYFVYEED
ncbi:MAG: hypothetical protein J6S03_05155 [Bacteroidaceae bacterium]|jgi:hypothetical protein|nr:hypothetical protein [Bacteroidaceae bacterium]